MKAQIYNLIIVDESGSMSCLRNSTLSGINETLNTIRQAHKDFSDVQEHLVTLVTFDSGSQRSDVRTLIDCQPIDQVGEFTDYHPGGCTPLYDAMGQSLMALHQRIHGNADASAVVTVITDGLENASREWRASRLRALIEQLKNEGWTFSYMGSAHDVKEVTELLSIDHVLEFAHDARGTASSWDYERSNRRAFFFKISKDYRHGPMSDEEKLRMKRRYSSEYYSDRVTPRIITHLEQNEIFVFGSNPQGHHDGGAAAFALNYFGAVWGQGEGLQGQSYAIPSTDGMELLRNAISRFAKYAEEHPEQRFLVTAIGCGSAGYSVNEVAPLFKGCIQLENVSLPFEFWKVLGLNF